MNRTINLKLIRSILWVTENWFECRERIGRLCQKEWDKNSISKYMWDNYIMVDTPITKQLYRLDDENLSILFRSLEANEIYLEDYFVSY